MEYKKLRIEFGDSNFKEMLEEKFEKKCYNCGSTDNLCFHHIVPVEHGGTNRLTNIIRLCSDCHRACHAESHHIRANKIRTGKRWGGVKSKCPDDYKEIIDLYINGIIGRRELKEKLGLSEKSKITGIAWFKDYLNELGIEKIINRIDRQKYAVDMYDDNSIVCSIKYKNGDIENICTSDVKRKENELKTHELQITLNISDFIDIDSRYHYREEKILHDFCFGIIGVNSIKERYALSSIDEILNFGKLGRYMKDNSMVVVSNYVDAINEGCAICNNNCLSTIKFENNDYLQNKIDGKRVLTNKKYLLKV